MASIEKIQKATKRNKKTFRTGSGPPSSRPVFGAPIQVLHRRKQFSSRQSRSCTPQTVFGAPIQVLLAANSFRRAYPSLARRKQFSARLSRSCSPQTVFGAPIQVLHCREQFSSSEFQTGNLVKKFGGRGSSFGCRRS
jgi:hypothetical protein